MSSDQQPATAYFRGNFSTGLSAVPRTVMIAFDQDAIVFREDDSGTVHRWPLRTLSAAHHLSRSDRDVLLHNSEAANASLFVTTPEFAAALLERAPELGAGRMRLLASRIGIAITAIIALAVGVVWLFDLSPSHGIAMTIPDRTWQNTGRRLIRTFTAEHAKCTDAKGIAALNKMLGRLVEASGSKAAFEVTVSDWTLVNAFMLPGRQMVLTRGIIQNVESPEELAGIIAHEMGHGIHQHPESGIVRALGIGFATQLLFTGTGGDTVANVGTLLLATQYTRGAEKEADDSAISTLRKARISPKPFAAFFQRMTGREKKAPTVPNPRNITLDIFSTHPNSADRAQKALTQPDYPTEPALSPAEWQELRAICGTMSKTPVPANRKPSTSTNPSPTRTGPQTGN
ncbi:MAG: M48 family metallopeptidase [Hyphomicrobiaceae bacterium]|nr:MAG: M48 family metallopeptidase [Hyphomicrobiaceae bacterium]